MCERETEIDRWMDRVRDKETHTNTEIDGEKGNKIRI